jgi:hypothetical protein
MHWLGLTLVAGIAGGYLTSYFVVGPLSRRGGGEDARSLMGRLLEWPEARGAEGYRTRFARVAIFAGRNCKRLAVLLLTVMLALPVWAEWVQSRQAPPWEFRMTKNLQESSWMRWRSAGKENGMWELFLAGDAETRGRETSRLAGGIDLRIENEMLDELDHFVPQEWARYAIVHGMAVNMINLPAYVSLEDQREIYWTARAWSDPHGYLAPTYPRILSYHALHDISQMLIDNPLIVPANFACTGVVSLPGYSGEVEGEGHLMMARVFDFEGGESFGRQKSVTYVMPEDGIPFAHVAWPGLSGAVTGMNRERIALFINAAATSDHRRIGTPTILMARDILQHAHSIAEAGKIIAATQVFVSDILVVADGKTGKARVFEKSPARMDSYDVTASAAITNHLTTRTFAEDATNKERMAEGTTMQRNARARQLLDRMAHHVTPEGLAALIRDKKGVDDQELGLGNRNAIDGLIACHGVIMDVSAGKMWVAAWPYVEGKFLAVDVLGMLDGRGGQPQLGMPPGTGSIERLPEMGEDAMMLPDADGRSGWERVQASRSAGDAAQAAILAGDPEKAVALAGEVERENPGFYRGPELRGRALLMRHDYAGARNALGRALAMDPPYERERRAIEGWIGECDANLR